MLETYKITRKQACSCIFMYEQNVASFPGPAQLFVACSTEKRSFVQLKVARGPGNEDKQNVFSFFYFDAYFYPPMDKGLLQIISKRLRDLQHSISSLPSPQSTSPSHLSLTGRVKLLAHLNTSNSHGLESGMRTYRAKCCAPSLVSRSSPTPF